MSPLQQSLLVLAALRNSVERVILCFYNYNRDSSELSGRPDRLSDVNLCFSVQNYLQVLLSSFLEEWSRFSALARDDSRVRDTLREVKPAVDRFRCWKDLRSVRSRLLAHPFRDRSGTIVFPWDVFRDSDVPTTLAETLLLGLCVQMVVARVQARHADDRSAAESQLLQQDRSVPRKGLSTTSELEAEFARIQAALQAACK